MRRRKASVTPRSSMGTRSASSGATATTVSLSGWRCRLSAVNVSKTPPGRGDGLEVGGVAVNAATAVPPSPRAVGAGVAIMLDGGGGGGTVPVPVPVTVTVNSGGCVRSHSTAAPRSPFLSTRACFAASHAASALASMPTVRSSAVRPVTEPGADAAFSSCSSSDGPGPGPGGCACAMAVGGPSLDPTGSGRPPDCGPLLGGPGGCSQSSAAQEHM
mmetsp:Transcript_68507/g.190515  ORF Transcript_68507/g.190515 Transcript_68507/m.190515 type:complete len:216 (+) Transcript_68507:388-1035(+)